eukprot:Rmarinus@m.11620
MNTRAFLKTKLRFSSVLCSLRQPPTVSNSENRARYGNVPTIQISNFSRGAAISLDGVPGWSSFTMPTLPFTSQFSQTPMIADPLSVLSALKQNEEFSSMCRLETENKRLRDENMRLREEVDKLSEQSESMKQTLQDITEAMSCVICAEVMTDPHVSPAGRSYCGGCLSAHQHANGNTDPYTRIPFENPQLYRNIDLRNACDVVRALPAPG